MEIICAYESPVNYEIVRGDVSSGSILQEITYLEEDSTDYGKGNAIVTLH
jgi:hypothetical protein